MEAWQEWKLALPHYLGCALWSTNDEDGEPLDGWLGVDDFDAESTARAEKDLKDFFEANAEMIDASGASYEQTAHDLWLTRNRHGAGFWDRGYAPEVGRALTDAAHAMGSLEVMVNEETATAYFQG